MSKPKKNKLLLYLGIAVVALIVIMVIGRSSGCFGKRSGTKVSVVKVEKQDIMETVSANGKIQPEMEVKISSDVSGEIRELHVKEGDSVRAGQLLARIDPEFYQSALDGAVATLNNSKANLANAQARLLQSEARFSMLERSFSRNTKLYEQKLISDAEFETAQTDYKNAKSDVEAARQSVVGAEYSVKSYEANVKQARKNLTRTEIFAPVNGIISSLKVEQGERVVGTAQMTGTEMMRLADLNIMEVDVDVNENDIVKVALGDTADIDVDAYPSRKFKGIVTEIANSATTSSVASTDQVTNFVVKIRLLQSSYADLIQKAGKKKSVFRPGMSASVEIETNKVYAVLAAPIEAISVRPKEDLDTAKKEKSAHASLSSAEGARKDDIEVAFLANGDKVAIRKVKTGIQDDKHIYIVEGLKEGDEIVSGPYSAVSKLLKHGDRITRVSRDELYEGKEKAD